MTIEVVAQTRKVQEGVRAAACATRGRSPDL